MNPLPVPLPAEEDMEDEGTKEGGVPAEGDVHPPDLTPRRELHVGGGGGGVRLLEGESSTGPAMIVRCVSAEWSSIGFVPSNPHTSNSSANET